MKNDNNVTQIVGVLKENQIFLPVTLCLISFLISLGNINPCFDMHLEST